MLSPQSTPLKSVRSLAMNENVNELLNISNANYRCEYEKSSNSIGFFSKDFASSRKCLAKVISFQIVDDTKFYYTNSFYDGIEILPDWIQNKLNEIKLDDNIENIDPNVTHSTLLFNTPDGNKIDKHQMLGDTDDLYTKKHADTSVRIVFSMNELKTFIEMFFHSNTSLDHAIEMKMKENDNTLKIQFNNTNMINHSDSIRNNKNTVMIPILISIEGNIGAGKSYLLTNLRKAHPEWCFIDEPVQFWESLKNNENESLLEVFYKDQRRWSYTFQNCALLSRYHNIETAVKDHQLNHHMKQQQQQQLVVVSLSQNKQQSLEYELCSSITSNEIMNMNNNMNNNNDDDDMNKDMTNNSKVEYKVFITERCLDTDYQVFAKMLHADGQLDKLEYELYQRWFALLQKTATPLSAIVYVDTVPNQCFERISLRARDGEQGIPLEYLTSLDTYQRAWIDNTDVPTVNILSDDMDKVELFVKQLIEQQQ